MLKAITGSVWVLRLPFWLILVTLGVGISWVWNLQTLEQHALSIAVERGRYTFKIIQSTRLWVAQHGVAYVRSDEKTPSNPYLDIKEKDITTPSGVALTAVNPAYMTRQLSGILNRQHDLAVHLTSLKPLNPNNQPDPWEASALEQFAQGVTENVEIVEQDETRLVRYMAPLFVKEACMQCHSKQGYQVGDVRGGISVSFDFQPFLQSTQGQKENIHAIHVAAWLVLSFFSYLTLVLIQRHENVQEQARKDAENLVELRTMELRDEVQFRRNAENQLKMLIDSTEEGIFGIDDQGRLTFMNPAGLNILGYYSAADVTGKPVNDIFPRLHADGRAVLPDECQITAAWQQGISGHSEDEFFLHKDKGRLAIEYHVHPIISHDKVIGGVVNFSDISVRKALQESMWRQANFDNLTGIPNRALFMDRLHNALEQARRGGFKLALLYADLNAFKPINDQYGHEAGDEVLRAIGQRLNEFIRESDTVARLGGDEFVVLLTQVENRAAMMDISEKIRHIIHKPIDIGGHMVNVNVSIGMAVFPDDADNQEALLNKADQMMYQEKERRR